ncbi:type I restriction endonuclease subunit R, partial [bacterium]|nr:type I restriction endonuclease subunit R [bacterium]
GRLNKKGQMVAFHLYSMKQAIEEGFVIDVLQSFTPYETICKLNKEIEEDPKINSISAKKQIARFIQLHPTNISQRVEIIVEHFKNTVLQELDGQAKAMVITSSREQAVKFFQEIINYIKKKKYTDVKPLVAFSGKVTIDEKEYSESGLNGFSEDKLPDYFDTDNYNILIVANKYQTGFDQKKLVGMYVFKKLSGVNAVQTFERLDRICPPYNKKTFILDFVNSFDDIRFYYGKFYTTTILSNTVTPKGIYDIEARIDSFNVIDPFDIENANNLLTKGKLTEKEQRQLTFYFGKCKKNIETKPIEDQLEFKQAMRSFIRFYDFLILASSFKDKELHQKYNFIVGLNAFLDIKRPGGGYDLTGKIQATKFVQIKGKTLSGKPKSNPIVNLPIATIFGISPDKLKHLSEIINELNSRFGNIFDNDQTINYILRVIDTMKKSEKLKKSAKSNTEKDFSFAFFDEIENTMIDEYEKNREFSKMILDNEDVKKETFGIFMQEIYKILRSE